MTKWYAVQETREDAWDYGSHEYEKAVEMLKEQGSGLIAVIDEDSNVCIEEIEYEEAENHLDGNIIRDLLKEWKENKA